MNLIASACFLQLLLLSVIYSFPTESDTGCGLDFRRASKVPKNLTSPNFPEPYPRNISCVWWIYTIYFYSDIHLEFKHLDLEQSNNCENDNLTIYQYYNGIEHVVQICGNETAHKKLELGSDVAVVFQTNNSTEGSGFLLQYYRVEEDSSERDNYRTQGYSDNWGTVVIVVFALTLITLAVSITVACYCQRKQARKQKDSSVQEVQFSGITSSEDPGKTHS